MSRVFNRILTLPANVVLAPVSRLYFLLSGEEKRWQPARRAKAPATKTRGRLGAQRAVPASPGRACSCVSAGRKHGAGSGGEGTRHGLHRRDDAYGRSSVETSAGVEVLKWKCECTLVHWRTGQHDTSTAQAESLMCDVAMLDTGTQFKVLGHRPTYHRAKARGKGPGTGEIVQKARPAAEPRSRFDGGGETMSRTR